MTDKAPIIAKVKLLLKLAQSPNENEAANAKAMAEKLIEKHGLSEAEYDIKDAPPIYTDDDLLFAEESEVDWKQIIAQACATKFDCFIIKEQQISSSGDQRFEYFIYGDPDDVAIARSLFSFVSNEIEALISKNCYGRGDLYIASYGEGAANSVRVNIEMEDYKVDGLVKPKVIIEAAENKEAIVSADKAPKAPPPIKERSNVSNAEKPIDIIAYWRGEGDGRHIHLSEMDENDLTLPLDNDLEVPTGLLAKIKQLLGSQ